MSLRLFLCVAPILSAMITAQAKEIAVFDIRRPISMENGQQLPKDYYINAGREAGLKVNMVVTVTRRQTLYDPFQNKSPGDLIVPVGRLRIIHTQEGLSVARLEDMLERDKLPNLEIDAITIGDRLDMTTAKMSPVKAAAVQPASPPTQLLPLEVLEVPPAGQTESSSLAPVQAPTL